MKNDLPLGALLPNIDGLERNTKEQEGRIKDPGRTADHNYLDATPSLISAVVRSCTA